MDTVLSPFMTMKNSETQSVDLENKVRGNHYLRHVDHRSTRIVINRTGSLKYMSDYASKGEEFEGYMCGCVFRKETQRIRTTNKFVRSSTDNGETTFC